METSNLKYCDDDVNLDNYIIPNDFDLEEVCHKITFGHGWVVLKKMFSAKDVEMARERLFSQKLINTIETFVNQDDLHNNYGGLTWGLLSRGRIFTKMAAHPIIMQVSQHLLGDNCRLSSFAANTVLPGMKGQKPHLDYPYYRHLWPSRDGCMNLPPHHLLALQIVTCLTDFTPENGSTAIVPGSHIDPHYPQDEKKFFDSAIQLTASPGDVIMFADKVRCGILQHMVPLYITPFEDLTSGRENEEKAIRQLLALENPHPILKYKRKNSRRDSYT